MNRVIVFESVHTGTADKVARWRQEEAVRRGRPAKNNAPTDPRRALEMHVLGCRGEVAGKLFLNPIRWNAFALNLDGLADLDTWIDVKAITSEHHCLLIQKDDPPDWAYLLVLNRHPRYTILGWTYGRDAQRAENVRDPCGGRPAHFIRQDSTIMRSPEELFDIVRSGAPGRDLNPRPPS